jgi:hypothetical protein
MKKIYTAYTYSDILSSSRHREFLPVQMALVSNWESTVIVEHRGIGWWKIFGSIMAPLFVLK